MKKTALVIIIITILSKMLGVGRDIVLSYYYGTSNISDAYFVAQAIPVTICDFIGVWILTGYIPMYSRIVREKNENYALKFTNNLSNFILIISALLILIVLLYTKQIVRLFASGFDDATLRIAISFTRISILGIYFMGLNCLYNSFLQIKENYVAPVLLSFPFNLITIFFIILSAKVNICLLVIGGVIAVSSQLLFSLFSIFKNGYRYNFTISIRNAYFKKLIWISLPVFFGVSVNQINILVNRTIASQLAVGAISALDYANKLNAFVQGIFVITLVTIMYPIISKMITYNDISGAKKAVKEVLNSVSILVLPIAIGSMVFSTEIIKFLFGRGAFDLKAIEYTSVALFYYSPGMIGIGFREVLTRAFYSMQDTKTPTINAVVGIVVNITLNIILSRFLGIGGLALATSIAAIFSTALLFISLHKKIGPFGMKQISISFLKILFASLIMGICAKLSFIYLKSILSQNLSLLNAICIGVVSYLVVIYFIKIEDVDVIVGAIKKKLGRGSA